MSENRLDVVGGTLMFADGLREATKQENEKVAKFKVKIVIAKDHESVKRIKAAVETAARIKFGEKWQAILKSLYATDKIFLKDGDNKSNWNGFEGNYYLNLSNERRPTLKDLSANNVVFGDNKHPAEALMYSGAKVLAKIEVFAYAATTPQGLVRGVSATIRGLQFMAHGERFGGGGSSAADDEFAPLAVDNSEEDAV